MKSLRRGIWFVFSLALHVVVVFLMLQALLSPRGFLDRLARRGALPTIENIHYVVPPGIEAQPEVLLQPPVVAPPPPSAASEPPNLIPEPAVPPAAAAAPMRADTGSGLAAAAGATGGAVPLAARPAFKDMRIWGAAPRIADPPRAVGVVAIRTRLDSIVAAEQAARAGVRDPSDWTIGSGKGKVGIDPQWIYLGPVRLPTALLGLVPLNVQSNPNSYENARTLGRMAAETRQHSAGAAALHDERAAINARMERLRAARQAAAQGSSVPPP